MKIAIAGASGFVGERLVHDLNGEHEIIALKRTSCDLFSLLQTEKALVGADLAIYLVHSMLPTATLNQTSFEDSDLLLADNFARAAEKAGVKRIIYLGGLIPKGEKLSAHLQSRLEVETALSSRKAKLTTLRASIILGEKGSSFQIVYLLVKRLPVMICPKWVSTLTQPIDIDDVSALIKFCVEHNETSGKSYDIGGPDILTYRDLMAEAATELGLKRHFLSVPFFSPGLSRLWVRLITGASKNLVYPLVESLKHTMVVNNTELLELYSEKTKRPLSTVRESFRKYLKNAKPNLRSVTKNRVKSLREKKDVRSIQRIRMPAGGDMRSVVDDYFEWVDKHAFPLIKVAQEKPGHFEIRLRGTKTSLLSFSYSKERSTPDRYLYYITGGVLARIAKMGNGRMEFRQVLDGNYFLSSIHDYIPSSPWPIYKYTQAVGHVWVMRKFARYLEKASKN